MKNLHYGHVEIDVDFGRPDLTGLGRDISKQSST